MKLIDIIDKLFTDYDIEPRESYNGEEMAKLWDRMRDDEFFDYKAEGYEDMYKAICKKYDIKDIEPLERERSMFDGEF